MIGPANNRLTTTIRLILVLLLCTSLTAVLTAAGTVRGRPSVAGLATSREAEARTTVWMIFRAPDCGISADLIDQLNRVDISANVKVIGVMLLPPSDSAERVSLSRSLGMKFEIIYDLDGVWKNALRRDQQSNPMMYVQEGQSLLGGISPQFVVALKALSLANVPMERER